MNNNGNAVGVSSIGNGNQIGMVSSTTTRPMTQVEMLGSEVEFENTKELQEKQREAVKRHLNKLLAEKADAEEDLKEADEDLAEVINKIAQLETLTIEEAYKQITEKKEWYLHSDFFQGLDTAMVRHS